MRCAALCSAAVLLTLLSPCREARGSDWPQWRGPNRDGISTETNWSFVWPKDGPKALWRANVGSGYSSVSVSAGRLYTMGNAETYVSGKDTVWCLDAETGKEIWKYGYTSKPGSYPGPRTTPTVDGDVLFAMSRHGDLFCLNLKNGAVLWKKNVRGDFGVKKEHNAWGLSCSPVVQGDKLLLDLGKILVLDKATGTLAFAMGDDPPAFSSTALVEIEGRCLVTSFNAFGLVVYDLADRKEIGRHKWEARTPANAATPIAFGDSVFISSGYDRGCALLRIAAKGISPVYESKKMGNDCSTSVLYKGHLYGVSGDQGKDGALKCLDFASGAVKWEKGGFLVGGGIVIADGKIIHMQDKGDLVIAEATPNGYEELARAEVLEGVCWTSPVLANGRIYCRDSKGNLVCLDVKR